MSKEIKHGPRGPAGFTEYYASIKIECTRLRGAKASKTTKNGEILLLPALTRV